MTVDKRDMCRCIWVGKDPELNFVSWNWCNTHLTLRRKLIPGTLTGFLWAMGNSEPLDHCHSCDPLTIATTMPLMWCPPNESVHRRERERERHRGGLRHRLQRLHKELGETGRWEQMRAIWRTALGHAADWANTQKQTVLTDWRGQSSTRKIDEEVPQKN